VSAALGYTLGFIQAELRPNSRILEVGCGNGELAASLQRDRHQVLAIDVSEEAIRETRDRGVAAQCCDFVEFVPSQPFDAVLFTRSLHHIHPLERAIDHAFALLNPGGLLLADDFDHQAMDHDTARWLYGVAEALRVVGMAGPGEFPGLAEQEPLEHWLRDDAEQPPLHAGPQMANAVAARFAAMRRRPCCYLFRYLCRNLRQNADGHAITAKLLEWETSLIERGRIRAIGLRLVARRPHSEPRTAP